VIKFYLSENLNPRYTLEVFENKKKTTDGIWEVSPQELLEKKDQVTIIDVRRPDEFTGELGHIEGAILVTLETEFMNSLPNWDAEDEIVFVCRSGARSGKATSIAQAKGFKNVYNMEGGMILWNELGLPKAS
jgi:rhodanese-related sulfurtransferase